MDSKDLQNIMEEMAVAGIFKKSGSHQLGKQRDNVKRTLQEMIEREHLLFEKLVYVVLPDETTGGYSVTRYSISKSDLIRALQESDM